MFVLRVGLLLLLSLHKSRAQCGPGVDPVECGKAGAARGESHIGIPRACFNRPDSGPCTQDLIRIYYDHTTYQCKAFSYGGCGGNANRFVSIKNCYKLCHPYYRQRFISLSVGKSEEEGGDSKEGEESSEAAEGETSEEPTTAEGEESESTTADSESQSSSSTTEAEDEAGVVYFKSSNGQKEKIKPEIQVVHEYDTFLAPQLRQQPMGKKKKK